MKNVSMKTIIQVDTGQLTKPLYLTTLKSYKILSWNISSISSKYIHE